MDDTDLPPDVVAVEFTQELDLHTFLPREVGELVDDYLAHAVSVGWGSVRIIHGKGTGVLRQRVHARLAKSPLVASFALADERAGGWGATWVTLKASQAETAETTQTPPTSSD